MRKLGFLLALVASLVGVGVLGAAVTAQGADGRDPKLVGKWETANGSVLALFKNGDCNKGNFLILKNGTWKTEKKEGKDRLICVWRDDAVFPKDDWTYTLSDGDDLLTVENATKKEKERLNFTRASKK